MKQKYFISLFLLFSFAIHILKGESLFIDNSEKHIDQKDPTVGDRAFLSVDYVQSLDSMLEIWSKSKIVNPNCDKRPNPLTNEEQYKERLRNLPHVIEMPYNSAVKNFIELYTVKGRSQMEYLLGLSKYYFPVFEHELGKMGLPLELKYLPIIESALNPTAVSRAGATGIWQFMLATGRMYGLEVNSLVDERRDPIKSSHVAAKYLKELHSIYNDWNLALAAYNCGPGNVNKAIARSGGKRDFWEIYSFLPAETRSYVPIFIAANYAMSYAEEHHLCPAEVDMPVLTDTVIVSERIHFRQIADVLDYPIEKIRLLNPQFFKDIIPGDIKAYPIVLPQKQISQFIAKTDEIRNYQNSELIARRDEVEVKQVAKQQTATTRTHVVRKGQNLSVIARQYRTTVNKIKRANGLKSNTIRAGQRLRIPS